MKKTNLTTLREYCPRTNIWDVKDMIRYHVDLEDKWNHTYQPIKIPKMNYPKAFKNETVGSWNFIKGCLP